MRDNAPSADSGPGSYLVVSTGADGRGGSTLVATDPGEAHREARRIAEAGGRAVVQYVTCAGEPRTLATYP